MLFNVFKNLFSSNDPTVQNADGGFDSMTMSEFYKFLSKEQELMNKIDILENKVIETLRDSEEARKFIYCELDGASMGNDVAKDFVNNSGVMHSEYIGAMHKYDLQGNDILLESINIAPIMSMMVNIKLCIVDRIMKKYNIGKYANISQDDIEIKEIILEIRKFLNNENFMLLLLQSQTLGIGPAGFGSQVAEFNNLFFRLSQITGINIENLKIEDILKDPIEYKRKNIFISDNLDKALDRIIAWADKNNLPKLYTEKNGYHEGIPRDKKQLFALYTLNLPSCQITELPKEIGCLINLKHLWLKDNKLKFLPDEICNLINLEQLYCPKNQIEKLPNNIGNLSKLYEINFRFNKINKYLLPLSILNLKNIEKFDLRNQEFQISYSEELDKMLNNDDDKIKAYKYIRELDTFNSKIYI